MDRIYRGISTVSIVLTVLVVWTTVLIGCGVEELQPGVTLADVSNTPLTAGMIVSVGTLDNRSEKFRVLASDESTGYNVPADLIRLFDTRAAAEQFVRDTEGVLGATALSGAQALRVRSEPETSADVVYRLRKGEGVTLVSSLETPVTINRRTGVWYEIIAGGRHRGYVFGPLLRNKPGDSLDEMDDADEVENVLAIIGDQPWWSRPSQSVFGRGGLDLEMFRVTGDLFELRIGGDQWRLPLRDGEISWPHIVFSDAGIGVTIRDGETVDIRIETEETTAGWTFVPMEQMTWNTAWAEFRRRNALAEQLSAYSGRYLSSTYGELEIHEDGEISWTGSGIPAPFGLPTAGARNMRVLYTPRLSEAVSGEYEGGLMLSGIPGGAEPAYLVDLLPEAVRLVWLPDFDPTRPQVSKPPRPPLVMYFSRIGDS